MTSGSILAASEHESGCEVLIGEFTAKSRRTKK